ncbi:MAG: hypothetical protein A3H97_15540 [Acidobacteria bacterium RIFCSPLOWO2_02_FULL_65_29]|nr:MAG: hypothetical protein A3H97_15540 [Acidobacteria bacterium RIFCSPLOWO2_02_FULL_65_29]
MATGGLGYVEREEKRFPTGGQPDVVLSTFDGSIEVRSWDQSEVLVVVEKHALDRQMVADIEVIAEQSGNRVTVEARLRPGRRGWGVNRGARLIVSMPASADLRATSGDGSITVERLTGRLELRSGDGSIRGHDLSGDIRAQTGDGSIRLDQIDGRLDVGTGDGSIVASGTLSTLRARSGDGSVRIRAELGSRATEDWDVSTGDGSVTIDLPDRFNAELDAHTSDGRVSVSSRSLSETAQSTRRSIKARLGEGGRQLRVRSGDGSIRLGRS